MDKIAPEPQATPQHLDYLDLGGDFSSLNVRKLNKFEWFYYSSFLKFNKF